MNHVLPVTADSGPQPQLLDALDQQILQLHVTNAHVKRRLAGHLQENMPPAALPLLGIVLKHPDVAQTEICDLMMIDKASLSRLVTRMEDAGVLTRTPDPEDRRVSRLNATQKAKERWTQIMSRQRGGWKARMSRWPSEDLAMLVALLERLNEDLRCD